jgi:PhnB protein
MQIVTSLSFKGQCRQAFEFYAEVLGGEITAAFPFGEGPPDMPVDAKYKDWLMHCWLQIGDQAIMGADLPPEFAPNIDKPKNGFDVTLHTKDVHEARRWFDALSQGTARSRCPLSRPSGRPVTEALSTSSACPGWSIPIPAFL